MEVRSSYLYQHSVAGGNFELDERGEKMGEMSSGLS